MPYIKRPMWAKIFERSIFIAVYALLAINGIIYAMLAVSWLGWVATASALVCILGAASGFYRFEWIALSPLIGSLLAGMFMVHASLSPYSLIFVVIIALVLIRRFLHLTLIARALRAE